MYVLTLTVITNAAAMMFSGASSVSQERERIAANRMHKAAGTVKNGLKASVMPAPAPAIRIAHGGNGSRLLRSA